MKCGTALVDTERMTAMPTAKRTVLICYAITFLVFLGILAWVLFGFSASPISEVMICYLIIMPITIFFCAMVIALQRIKWSFIWLYPLVFVLLPHLISLILFRHPGIFAPFYLNLFPVIIPSLLGLGIGFLIKKYRLKKNSGTLIDRELIN